MIDYIRIYNNILINFKILGYNILYLNYLDRIYINVKFKH